MPELNATAPTVPLQFDQGDDETITLTRHAADGTALDITDYTFKLTVKADESDADADAVLQKTVDAHTDPANGETEIDLTSSETETLAGTYHYELDEQTAAGVSNTLIVGRLFVRVGATTSTGSGSSAGGTIAVTVADAAAGVNVSVTSGLPDAVTVTSLVSDGRLLVSQTVAAGETVEIPADHSMVVSEPFEVDGELHVDGAMQVVGETPPTIRYDEASNSWVLGQPLDFQSEDARNIGTLDATELGSDLDGGDKDLTNLNRVAAQELLHPTSVASGETLRVPADKGMVATQPFDVDGELRVNGQFKLV
jgi:hypothetical protein